MKVLLADNNNIALTVLRTAIENAGYAVETAEDGPAALERTRAGEFGLVVSDWNLPGLKSMEFCKAVRSEKFLPHVYIILTSVHYSFAECMEGLTAGADDFIAKPFEPEELLARIREGERFRTSSAAKRHRALLADLLKRREAEQALRNNGKWFRSLPGVLPVGIYHADHAGKFDYVNRRWCELAGLSLEEAAGDGWQRALYVEDRKRVSDDWTVAIQRGEAYRGDYRFVHADGQLTWVFGQSMAERDDAGDVIGYVGTIADMSEYKRAGETNASLAAMVEASEDAIIGLDLEGVITSWNSGARAVFGYEPAQAIGKRPDELIPELCRSNDAHVVEDVRREYADVMEAVRRGECVRDLETQRRRKDGEKIYISLSVSPVRNAAGYVCGACKIARDITQRKAAEEAYRESKLRYRFLADAMPQIVWSAGADGRNGYCNQQWYRYTGLSVTQTAGNGWVAALHPDDVATSRSRWNASLETGQLFEVEYRIRRASDGMYRWHLVRAMPMRDAVGRIIQWVGTSTDIHDQKLIETTLDANRIELEKANRDLSIKNNKLAELYRTAHAFVDDVSHEFRTPLTVIKEFASIMRDGLSGEVTDEQKEFLGIVVNRVDDLGTMVNDLLDMSKLEAGMLGVCRRIHRPADVIEAARTTLQRKAAAQRITLEFDIDDDLPQVFCDLEKVGRIITNLTVNAVKFSNEAGRVIVWVRRAPGESDVSIGVTDFGPGIAPENIQTIFERFKQLDEGRQAAAKGFGLGLSIAKELVYLNFGEMHVESTLGKGSTFSFTLPIADPRKLIERWIARVEQVGSRFAHASIVAVQLKSRVNAPMLDDVQQFLEHQVRHSDVLLPAGVGRWIWAVAVDSKELPRALDRVGEAISEENRNRPFGALPEVMFDAKGTWRLGDGSTEFTDCIDHELNGGGRPPRSRPSRQATYEECPV